MCGKGGYEEGVEDEKGWDSSGGEKGDLPEGFPSRVCGIPGCLWLFGVV